MVNPGPIEPQSLYPHIFIGLGGSGSRVIDRIAGRLERLPQWETKMQGLFHFLAIDTNDFDLKDLAYVPPENRFGIQVQDKKGLVERMRKSSDQRVLRWLDPAYRPREGQNPGAGQIRLEARFGFYFNSPSISQALDRMIQGAIRPNPYRSQRVQRVLVYIYASVAGGTGSGAFLPMAYLAADRVRAAMWEPQVFGHLMLSTLFLDKVQPELHTGIHANSYAALKELEHLTKLSYFQEEEIFDYVRDGGPELEKKVHDRPFFMTSLFDRPSGFSVDDYEAVVADGSFVSTISRIGAVVQGAQDNYSKENTTLTKLLGDTEAVVKAGFTKAFGTYGAAALVVPVRELAEYCAYRFAAQAIEELVTFSRVPAEARMLVEDHAVDYSDPKFIGMDQAAQAGVINASYLSTVQALSRLDADQERTMGYWFRLVEGVDAGLPTGGVDAQGQVLRESSLVERMQMELTELRSSGIQRNVKIEPQAFTFEKENVAQYDAFQTMLRSQARTSLVQVEEWLNPVVLDLKRGKAVESLNIDPLTERYLLIRLRELLVNRWIPEAERQKRTAESNWALREEVKTQLEEGRRVLAEAASGRGFISLFARDRFGPTRSQVEDVYRGVARSSALYLSATADVAIYRALLEFVEGRLKDYLTLALNSNKDVEALLSEARVLEGSPISATNFALATEVLRTQPPDSKRLWHVYYERYLASGAAKVALFDRDALSTAIRQAFAARRDPAGTMRKPTPLEISRRLREGFLDVGRERLKAYMLGERQIGSAALGLERALEIEADLVLSTGLEPVEESARQKYIVDKVTGFSQQAGLLGRVSPGYGDDGVVKYDERLALLPTGMTENSIVNRALIAALSISEQKLLTWEEPFTLVVYSIIANLPIPYFKVVEAELEPAYYRVLENPTRSYNLHTDLRWEYTLPDLSPGGRQGAADKALDLLVSGLATGVLIAKSGQGATELEWQSQGRTYSIGKGPSQWVYLIQKQGMEEIIAKRFQAEVGSKTAVDVDSARPLAMGLIENLLADIAGRRLDGFADAEDKLTERLLKVVLERVGAFKEPPRGE